jgi:RNA polymerase sigma-70 factor (sigma-E family)
VNDPSPREAIDSVTLDRITEVLQLRNDADPDDARSDVLSALYQIRNMLMHGAPVLCVEGEAEQAVISRVMSLMTELEKTSLGTANAQRVRSRATAARVADILARHEKADVDRAVMALYGSHYRALVRLSALLVRDISTAEKVVNDSFVAVHASWRRLRDTEEALSYLRRAVVNRSRSVLWHRVVADKNAPKTPPPAPSTEQGAILQSERSAVVVALRALPVRQREAIVLRYYADLSEAQIASAMGTSRGAVKSHIARGLAALRSALEIAPESNTQESEDGIKNMDAMLADLLEEAARVAVG